MATVKYPNLGPACAHMLVTRLLMTLCILFVTVFVVVVKDRWGWAGMAFALFWQATAIMWLTTGFQLTSRRYAQSYSSGETNLRQERDSASASVVRSSQWEIGNPPG